MTKLRFRSGQVQLVKCRVDSGTVIEAGDMVWLDGDDVKPASSFAWDTNLATTQGAFAAKFLGIAHQQSKSGDVSPVSVDLSPLSVYEMDVPSTTYEVGTVLGPDDSSSTLQDQQLETVASAANGIARSVEFKATVATTLRVSFASAYCAASANVNATVG